MSDNLGGIQRHSTSVYWDAFRLYILEDFNTHMHPDEWIRINEMMKSYGISYAPQFIYRKGVRKFALLVSQNNDDTMSRFLRDEDIYVASILTLREPSMDGTRMIYEANQAPMGVLCSRGGSHGNQYRPFVILDVNTGQYFEPRMAGFITTPPGDLTVSVNEPSRGARYRDQA